MNGQEDMYKINQVVEMDGEKKNYEQTVDVEVIERRDRYYRYTERLDEHAIDVVLRAGTDFIKIQRRGIIDMNFHFVEGEMTDTFYESPAGRHHFTIVTKRLLIWSERIEIDYELHDQDGKLGDYYYKIRKVG